MALSSAYAPNESYSSFIQELRWFQGTLFSNFFFGIQTTLCILAFLAVLRRQRYGRTRIVLLVYIAVLFVVTATVQGLMLAWIQMGFITQRNYPGGPSVFLNDEWSIPINSASNTLGVCANWMMESLMVWRCHVLCTTGERLWWLGTTIPLLLLIAVFVTGSLLIHHILHTMAAVPYVLAYGVSSLALNLIATGFIAGRLLVHRRRIVSQLGRGHGHHYVSITAIVVESAAVYTSYLIVTIVSYAIGSSATNILQLVFVPIQTITSLLIILRIARGEGWSKSAASTDGTFVGVSVSSLNTRVRPSLQPNVIQLEVLSARADEAEEHSTKGGRE